MSDSILNANEAESLEVADHYATRRAIPAANKCAVAREGKRQK